MRLFTKSAFKEALTCPARLNYFKNAKYANQNLTDEFLQSLAEGGFQVGELAKVYYGVPPENDLSALMKYEEPLKRTQELFAQEKCVIAEAAFRFGNMFIRADIVRKEGHRVELVEVKAKSWDPSGDVFAKPDRKSGRLKVTSDIVPYVYDVAFQKYVLRNALKELYPGETFDIHAALMMADKSKVADVAGINQCFKIVKSDGRTSAVCVTAPSGLSVAELPAHEHIVTPFFEVDELCDEIAAGNTVEQSEWLGGMAFVPFATEMARRYCAEEQHFCDLSTECFTCPYYASDDTSGEDGYDQCWKTKAGLTDVQLKRPLLEELWGGGNTRLRGALLAARKYLLEMIGVDDLGTTERKAPGLTHVDRKIVQLALMTNRPQMLGDFARNVHDGAYIDIEGLRNEISGWKYPLHMIDFETSAVALPFYAGLRPYEQIAFQYSHHVIDKTQDGGYAIRHAGQFINVEKGKFPNFDFLRSLKAELEKDEGSIFRYSNHENTILCAIRDQLELSAEQDKGELIAFIDSVTHRTIKPEGGGRAIAVAGPRDMIDLCETVKRFYYHPSMKGSNSIKAVLPAVLNSSKFLQDKYSAAIYGSIIHSLNIPADAPIAWITRNPEGTVANPYKKLPSVASYFPEGSGALVEAQEASLEEVANGGAALSAYGLLQFSEGVQADALAKALLRYCELDTMAMVFIWEYFNYMINNN